MMFFCLFHFKSRNQVFINIEIQIQQSKHYYDLTHIVKMFISDVCLKLISFSEYIHRYNHSTGPNQKCPGNKIGAKVGTVPSRAIGGRK
ncbi:hypothetical protein D3C78_1538400 [compost metagenome]